MSKVMIVEDDAIMLSLLKTLLEIEGFQTVIVDHRQNMDTVLEALNLESPDLLLLDVHLDRYNGFDLLRFLRKDNDLNHMRILVSSGSDLSRECTQAGVDGFILKPYMPEDLINQIYDLLGK